MDFKRYMHLERFGTTEVQNIELGKVYVFPKIDGTNASVWLNNKGEIQSGSRKCHLSENSDNAGFYNWVIKQHNILEYLKENPTHRLFGEWLVPHSLKTYRQDAWRKFYVFDVAIDNEDENDYLHYDFYKPLLESKGISYITPICIINNASYEQLINQLMKNTFLIEDGKGYGEGIVIKNYDFKNKFGKNIFAKIVTSEFKEKHKEVMGASEINGKQMVEEEIAKEFVTTALIEKVYSKIENESGFSGRNIPELLNTVFYDVIKEDSWQFIKKHKNPTINFKTLQHFIFAEIKLKKPNIF
ncbi:MAG: RNA ligase family protein [Bacteroidia bacterium]